MRKRALGLALGAALTAAAACESSGSGSGPVGAKGGASGAAGGAATAGAGGTGGRSAQTGASGTTSSAGTMSAIASGGSSSDDGGAGGESASGGPSSGAGGNPAGPLAGAAGEADSGGSDGAGLGGRGGAGSGGLGSAGSSGGSLAGGSNGGQSGAGTANAGAPGSAGTSSAAAGTSAAGTGSGGGAGTGGGTTGALDYVFVITMENHDPGEIVGNTDDAPYINATLLANYAQGTNFKDQFSLPTPSEPHYIWMEAGTNVFSDHTFTTNDAPSASHSTSDTNHLVTQLATAGVSWMSYQEDMDATSGACPIASSGHYHPRHNPFVFFQDVAGDPPSKTNAYCAAHHKEFGELAADLADETVARYNFITPNLCNDMHGHTGCPSSNLVRMGDDWLLSNMPALIAFVTAHAGVIFIVWDEGDATTLMPFIAIGPGVKAGYSGDDEYTHGSLLKSLELILDVPVSSRVSAENDFSDLFEPGAFP